MRSKQGVAQPSYAYREPTLVPTHADGLAERGIDLEFLRLDPGAKTHLIFSARRCLAIGFGNQVAAGIQGPLTANTPGGPIRSVEMVLNPARIQVYQPALFGQIGHGHVQVAIAHRVEQTVGGQTLGGATAIDVPDAGGNAPPARL